jgi:hypothetical protein
LTGKRGSFDDRVQRRSIRLRRIYVKDVAGGDSVRLRRPYHRT